MKHNFIHFIMTGGTLDYHWDNQQDIMVMNEESDVPVYFDTFPLLDEVTFTQVCLKDSREFTDQDLAKILEVIEHSEATNIVITHGSWTVAETVRYLKKNLKRKDQTIVVTSSSVPLLGLSMSDAPFNLGFAVAKVQDLPANIYIAMKGRAFSLEEFDTFTQGGKLSELYGSKK